MTQAQGVLLFYFILNYGIAFNTKKWETMKCPLIWDQLNNDGIYIQRNRLQLHKE